MAKQKEKTIKQIQEEFIKDVLMIARTANCHSSEVTRDQFRNLTSMKTSDYEQLGSFSDLRKKFFPKVEVPEMKHGSQLIESHRKKLTKTVGMTQFVADEMCKVFKETLETNPLKFHRPVALKSKSKNKINRTIVAHWSDSHFGANIHKSEVQVNEYTWTIAARRLALFVEQICQYKQHYRKETELVFCINGDIIAGVIHDQEWFADLLTDQYVGAIHLLGQAISYLAQHYVTVKVLCSPGNHGRAMHKKGTDRATTHKHDSYETMIYVGLKHALSQYKNVEVQVPKTPFVIFNAQGHNFFMTHGDTVVNVGNPGKSLNMKEINNQINKINASELGGKDKFAAIIMGHVHTPTIQLSESGCMTIINGCSSGVDPFAQSIGIFESNPTQQIFEVTPEHAVGDVRLIQLKPADDRKDLDKIVEPYNKDKKIRRRRNGLWSK